MADRYWVGGSATWDGTAGSKWATTSGGAGGAAIPTSADDVFFDANSGAVTVTQGTGGICRNLNFTGFTGSWTVSSTIEIHGSITLVAGMTKTGTGTINLRGANTGNTITSAGKSFAVINLSSDSSGDWTLQDTFSCTLFRVTVGCLATFNTNGKTVTCSSGIDINANGFTLTLGSSTINASTTFQVTGGFTLNAGTSHIILSSITTTPGFANKTYYDLTYDCAAIGGNLPNPSSISSTFHNLTLTNGADKTSGLRLSPGGGNSITVTGTLTITGNSATNRLFIRSTIVGTPIPISAAAVALSNTDFMDVTAGGAAISWTGTSLGDGGGNTNITFTTPVTRYWVGNSGNFSDTTHWSTSTGGASGASVPLPQDSAIFDANSFSSGSQTATADMPRMGSISFTGVANTPALAMALAGGYLAFGNFILSASMTLSCTENVTFINRSIKSLSLFGLQLGASADDITFNCPGGGIMLGANYLTAGDTFLVAGTFNAVTYNFESRSFASDPNSIADIGTRSILMGSGTWIVGGNDWIVGGGAITLDGGTSLLQIRGTISNFQTDNFNYYNLYVKSGLGIIFGGIGGIPSRDPAYEHDDAFESFLSTNSPSFNDLKIDPSSGIYFEANVSISVNSITSLGTALDHAWLRSNPGSRWYLLTTKGLVSTDYLDIEFSRASDNRFFAGANSTDLGHNEGWIFATAPVAGYDSGFFAFMR